MLNLFIIVLLISNIDNIYNSLARKDQNRSTEETQIYDKNIIKFFDQLFDPKTDNKIEKYLEKLKPKETPKISIILPIYNKEKFIRRVVKSIQMQTFKNIEIILVDDGSTDNSYEIMQKEAEKDKRIVLVQNGRNRGIVYTKYNGFKHSKGKYILFMDPDDGYCNKKAFKILYDKAIESKGDMIHFMTVNVLWQELKQKKIRYLEKVNGIPVDFPLTQPDINKYMIHFGTTEKMFSRKLVEKLFDVLGDYVNNRLVYGDDRVFCNIMFQYTEKYVPLFEILAFYNRNPQGTTYEFLNNKDNPNANKQQKKSIANHMMDLLLTDEIMYYTKGNNYNLNYMYLHGITIVPITEMHTDLHMKVLKENHNLLAKFRTFCNKKYPYNYLSPEYYKKLVYLCKKIKKLPFEEIDDDL